MLDLRSCRCVLGAWLAAVMLTACGGANIAVPGAVPQTTGGEAARSYTTPPNVTGTYRGLYTETRNGQTVKGNVRIVVGQKRFKITGSFEIRGHDNPMKTYFVGKVKELPRGALLRFQVVWLAGYGDSVNFHARVIGTSLDGEGQSQVTEGNEASRWKIRATKATQ